LSQLHPFLVYQETKNRWFTLVFVASQRQVMAAMPAMNELVF
jgi:hypothetical protein